MLGRHELGLHGVAPERVLSSRRVAAGRNPVAAALAEERELLGREKLLGWIPVDGLDGYILRSRKMRRLTRFRRCTGRACDRLSALAGHCSISKQSFAPGLADGLSGHSRSPIVMFGILMVGLAFDIVCKDSTRKLEVTLGMNRSAMN